MTFLALVALWGMALAIAGTVRACMSGRRGEGVPPGIRAGAGVLVLAAFVFVPPGSVPPLCNTAWGGGAALACLGGASFLALRLRALLPLAALGLTAAALAFFVWSRGFPGSYGNLGTFVAVPVWSVASLPEMAALVLLGAGSFVAGNALVAAPGQKPGLVLAVSSLLLTSLWVALFIPWTLAPRVGWKPTMAAGADMLLFWCKSGLLSFFLLRVNLARVLLPGAACCLVGAVLLGALVW